MAGIEPASARLELRTSTSVEGFLIHNRNENPSNNSYRYPLEPESSLSPVLRNHKRQLQLCVACPTTGWRTELADVAIIGHVLFSTDYAAKGRAAKLVRLALNLLY